MLRREEKIAIHREALKNNRHQANTNQNSSSNYWSHQRDDSSDGSKHHREHHPREFDAHPSLGSRPDDEASQRFPPIFRDNGPASSSIPNKFWFEKVDGTLIGGVNGGDHLPGPSFSGKRVRQSSDDDSGPSEVKLARSSLNGNGIKQEDQSASDGNNVMEVDGINPRHLQARIVSSVGTAVVSIDNADQVKETIKKMKKEEFHRRVKMMADLEKLCKAIPLTVKMVNPLINFNGLPNN